MRRLLAIPKPSSPWLKGLAATAVFAFIVLLGQDLLCKYQYFTQPQHEHHQADAQPTAMPHCSYVHQATSTVMPSLGVFNLGVLNAVGTSVVSELLVQAFDVAISLSARAPPAL